LTTYPNPVEDDFPQLLTVVRMGYGWLCASLGVFVLGVALNIASLAELGLVLLFFAPGFVGAPLIGLRRVRRGIPVSVEVLGDRLVLLPDPRYVRPENLTPFVLPFSSVTGVYRRVRRVVPHVNFAWPTEKAPATGWVPGLRAGKDQRSVALTVENLDRLRAAGKVWRERLASSAPLESLPA
jgi:hypothetical protein